MSDPAQAHDSFSTQAGSPSCEALVVGVAGNRVDLHLVQSDGCSVSARVAVLGYVPAVGDRVLVHGRAWQCYVIGVLHAAQPCSVEPCTVQPPSTHAPAAVVQPHAVHAADGARAVMVERGIELRDREDRLLVRYDSESGALTLSADADLNLLAPHGNILMQAGGTFNLSAQHTRLASPRLELESADADFAFGRIEVRGERLLSKLTDAFVEVERVAETRARRLRTLVETTLELVAQRTSIRSEKDTRIDGNRVLLG